MIAGFENDIDPTRDSAHVRGHVENTPDSVPPSAQAIDQIKLSFRYRIEVVIRRGARNITRGIGWVNHAQKHLSDGWRSIDLDLTSKLIARWIGRSR